MDFARRMLSLDRRGIFLLIAVVTLLPLLYPVGLPIRVSPEVRKIYDHIESLPEGAVFLLSFDFEPAGKPELYPMSVALLRHAFRKRFKVLGVTLWPAGTGMAELAFAQGAQESDKEKGKDYVFLGYAPGEASAIISMGQDLYAAFPTDYYGATTADLPMLKNVRSLRDIQYAVSLSAGVPGIDTWYVYSKEKYGFELGGGCTAVSAPRFYPLLNTGQINGLLGGLRGAAEYETLMGREGKATAGMDAQSATHFLIIVLILLCNCFYFLTGQAGGRRK
ncbi:MAG: hypothetical protein HYZ72_11095 [Deltaproteobacteria bacterium]|nr:hypothetical protein [Deltaproteobacteria bacterium]